MFRIASYYLIALLNIIAIEAIMVMILGGTAFNSIDFPVFTNLDFIFLLIANNPVTGLQELFGQPVFIIGAKQVVSNDYVSALYFYPFGALLHLLVTYWIVKYMLKDERTGMRGFVIGMLLLFIVLPNIWLASCCGSVPGWLVDIALRLYVFAPGGDAIGRLELYENLLPVLLPLRLVIGATGLGLLWRRSVD